MGRRASFKDILIALGLVVFGAVCVVGLLRLFFGKNRPTKLLKAVIPCIMAIALSFFVLGKYGADNLWAIAGTPAVLVPVTFINFMLIASQITMPLNRIVYSLNSGAEIMVGASKEIVETAKARGKGWIDYYWLHPIIQKIELKSGYYEKMSTLVMASGASKEEQTSSTRKASLSPERPRRESGGKA